MIYTIYKDPEDTVQTYYIQCENSYGLKRTSWYKTITEAIESEVYANAPTLDEYQAIYIGSSLPTKQTHPELFI